MSEVSSTHIATLIALCTTSAIALNAQSFTTLYTFRGPDGRSPNGTLLQATNGALYGTTSAGGRGVGTIFKINPSGKLTMLYSFCAQTGCPDGEAPVAGLVRAANGNFYGAAQYGGEEGFGTVFKITPAGNLTTLHSFLGVDGQTPQAMLIQASNGDLYGTTYGGGVGAYCSHPCDSGAGTVFKITPSGSLTTLHSFCSYRGCKDGSWPGFSGLVQAADGNLYGTTNGHGSNGQGTVFRISPSGQLATLYSFCAQAGCLDGAGPTAGLVKGLDGDMYGTTYGGGANAGGSYLNGGTVFKVTPGGTLTTLYSFCAFANCTDGANPHAALVQGTDGNFYGTTDGGGVNAAGTIFEVTPDGSLTTLYSFCAQPNCADGSNIYAAGLIQGANGDLYGTTPGGGTYNSGTVFSLSLLGLRTAR